MRGRFFYTFIVVAEILVLLVLAALAALWIPYRGAQSRFPENGKLYLEAKPDGSLLVQWPDASGHDRYRLELVNAAAAGNEELLPEALLFSAEYPENECTLDSVSYDDSVFLRITALRDFRQLGREKIRESSNCLSAYLPACAPTVSDFTVSAYEGGTAEFSWETDPGCQSLIYVASSETGDYSLLAEPEGERLAVSLGEHGDLPMPEFREKVFFRAIAYLDTEDLQYVGCVSDAVSVQREDFLSRTLSLRTEPRGNNVYEFTWDETPGDTYRLELLHDGAWQTVCTRAQGEPRSFSTRNLPACSEYTFRLSVSGTELAGCGDYPVEPEETAVTTEECAVYATVWPLQTLTVYAEADPASDVLGDAPAMTAYSVLAEENGMFRIRTAEGQYGYLDADYCLINLCDYLGALCAYNITNSYDSLYMVHEFEIPEVTGTVIDGYETVALADGTYLVPLLYPAAQKLCTAAKAAQSEGYRLKIYDAFRPNRATREIYDKTELILNEPLPDEPYLSPEGEVLREAADRPVPRPRLTDKTDETERANETDTPDEEKETYLSLLQNSTYQLSNFLAKNASLHNIGIALDLTLERCADHEELKTQTRMHDLSVHSVRAANEQNAERLSRYMTGAGFGILTSEWWHYQDNEARSALKLATQYWGVSVEGWKADPAGWRYRCADGSYLTAESALIDGKTYSFDAEGYVVILKTDENKTNRVSF